MRFLEPLVLCAILSIATAAHAASVTVGSGNAAGVVTVDGVIDGGDDQKLAAALSQVAASGKKPIVMLDSRGGDVDVSMAMGRIIRQSGAATYHRYCASACVYAFLGGTQRFVNKDSGAGVLNVHRPEAAEAYVHNPTPTAKGMLDMLKNYTVEMIGNPAFFDAMMNIPFQTPHALGPQEAMQMQVATGVAR